MNDTPTPRTDARAWDWHEDCCPDDDMIVDADFARQLERELAELRKQRDRLAEALREIAEHAVFCNTKESAMKHVRMSLEQASKALAAVEGGANE